MPDSAKLQYEGREIELPVVIGTENERAIDVAKLRAEAGLVTLDEGYVNTGSTRSAITYLDGERGSCVIGGIRLRRLPSTVISSRRAIC
jgi:citrate synthase